MRRSWPLAIVVVLALAAPAQAAPSQKKAMWGPAEVNGVSQFPIYRDLGVGIWQGVVYWHRVAREQPRNALDPNDPAYRWDSEIDFAVAEAARYGIKVALMITRTPGWANGGRDETAPPTDPQDFARFVVALAKRYPSVRIFVVWGEPIRMPNFLLHPTENRNYFAPSSANSKPPPLFNAQQRRDARKYAALVDATYGRLKKLSRRNLIVGGNTTTSGDVDPFNWIRFMRLRDGRPPRMDLYGHNPFGTRQPDLAKNQIIPATADFCDLDVLVPWVDRWLDRGGRNHKLKIYISEYSVPTDVPSYEFPIHVTREVQARWIEAGMKITQPWSRIYTFGWIGLRDHPPLADGRESRLGLIDAQGQLKPGYYAFKNG